MGGIAWLRSGQNQGCCRFIGCACAHPFFVAQKKLEGSELRIGRCRLTSIRRNQRGPGKKPAKVVSLRLDPLVVSTFKARGKYWQRDINETLLRAVKRRRASPRSRLESLLGLLIPSARARTFH
ncbi:MAG: BrnA antitoxin family protein [Beijerinckiaceae bacterium]